MGDVRANARVVVGWGANGGQVEGFLLKQGVGPLLGKRYKRRWFKLVGTEMRYYKAQSDPEPIGFIDLKKGAAPAPPLPSLPPLQPLPRRPRQQQSQRTHY